MAGFDLGSNDLSNSFIIIDNLGELGIYDIRQSQACHRLKMNPLLGVPSCLKHDADDVSNIHIGTYRGFVTRFDLRLGLLCEQFRLHKNDKPLPVTSINEFVPVCRYSNMRKNERCVLLAYPSRNNEFSVFSSEFDFEHEHSIPKIHFLSEVNSGYIKSKQAADIKVTTLPCLQMCNPQSMINIKEDYRLNIFEALKVAIQASNVFRQGTKALLGILQKYHENYFSPNKFDYMEKMSDNCDDLLSMHTFDQSIRKAIVLPSPHSSKQAEQKALGNIIVTAGEDRIIRFLDLGAEGSGKKPMSQAYDTLNCYHIFNPDSVPRSFYYHYLGGTCVVKENTGTPVVQRHKSEFFTNPFDLNSIQEFQNENGFSSNQNYHFSSNYYMKQKSLDGS